MSGLSLLSRRLILTAEAVVRTVIVVVEVCLAADLAAGGAHELDCVRVPLRGDLVRVVRVL